MKRITSVLLASALIVGVLTSLVACGNNSTSEAKETTSEATENTITADVSSNAADEITPGETEVNANTAEYFDPFEGIYIECSGADGDITVDVNFDNAYYDKSAYSITGKTTGLSDGDEVTVTVSDLVITQTEESDGLMPKQTTKSFPVVADSKYITNANDIPEEFIEEYANYFEDKIYNDYGFHNGYRVDEYTEILSVEYVGYKFAVHDVNPNETEVKNQLIFYYDVSYNDGHEVSESDGRTIWNSENARWDENLVNLIINSDGTISYEDENNAFPLDNFIILANTVEN